MRLEWGIERALNVVDIPCGGYMPQSPHGVQEITPYSQENPKITAIYEAMRANIARGRGLEWMFRPQCSGSARSYARKRLAMRGFCPRLTQRSTARRARFACTLGS